MLELVEKYKEQLLETVIFIAVWFILRALLTTIIKRRLRKSGFKARRKRVAMRGVNLILNLVFISAVIIIWSVDQGQILFFLSSVVTVLGVAFFAQWSHLSNITSGIIMFFNTSTKVGDRIKIMDKDFDIEGEIFDIGAMFFTIQTDDEEMISLPNNIIVQKAIKVSGKTEE